MWYPSSGWGSARAGAVAILLSVGCEPIGNSGIDGDEDGWTPAMGDCDDEDASVHPEAPDPLDDALDQDCNGVDGPHAGALELAVDRFLLGEARLADLLLEDEDVVGAIRAREVPAGSTREEALAELAERYGESPPESTWGGCAGYAADLFQDGTTVSFAMSADDAPSLMEGTGYETGANCRFPDSWPDCPAPDAAWSFDMGHKPDITVEEYAPGLSVWHPSTTARALLDGAPGRVDRYRRSESPTPTRFNAYLCLPWQLHEYLPEVRVRQAL